MHSLLSALTVASLLYQVSATPAGINGALPNVLATKACNHDNLYRSFVDPRYSSAASALCSSFIQPTTSIATTTTSTFTSIETDSSTYTVISDNYVGKRTATTTSLFASVAPSSLSSACSCILTSADPTATTYITTVVIPTTTTTTTTIPVATDISKNVCASSGTNHIPNGGFEAGLSGWSTDSYGLDVLPAADIYSPGYNSNIALELIYNLPSDGYSGALNLQSSTFNLAAGVEYTFSFWFKLTSAPHGDIECYLVSGDSYIQDAGTEIIFDDQTNTWLQNTNQFIALVDGEQSVSCLVSASAGVDVVITLDEFSITC